MTMNDKTLVVACDCGEVFEVKASYVKKTLSFRFGNKVKEIKIGKEIIPDFLGWPEEHKAHKINGWMTKESFDKRKEKIRRNIERAYKNVRINGAK